MRVVIAGGHGKIALRLERLLAARGDQPVGLVRDPDHEPDLLAAGAVPLICDLERAGLQEVAVCVEGTDAAVFAAGAGPGSGAARKDTMDRAGAALFAEAAQRARVSRFLLVSSMGLDRAERLGADDVFGAYLRAKAASEADLRARDLDWTILRPGRLTDGPGTGRVRLGPPPVPRGEVSRQDVAEVLLALLDEPASAGLTLELVGGDTPVREAVAAACQAH
ncbi:MAG TPA: SDR family oxidoreductase [Micromonosporaceae bacterium]